MGELTLGLIGCGGNMGGHRRAYEMLWNAGLRDFRIGACRDVDTDKAQAMADQVAQFRQTRPAVYGHREDMLATELKEFIDACRLGTPIETDGWDGYRAMAICFALYESHAIHAPVNLEDIESLKLEAYQQDINEGLGLV